MTVPDPCFSRVVYVNQHCIQLIEYRSMREECRVNGSVWAQDTLADIAADLGSSKASEAFECLTGFWRADWDRTYRRLYWSEWTPQTIDRILYTKRIPKILR